ncbi:MAG: hypothetical protein KDE51_18990, partial [Anaerolineales bacterium]|nr:hypothetical protein [Anaerolineales bacterium]
MSDLTTLGTLHDFMPDIPGATAVIDEIRQQELYETTVLDRVHILDYTVYHDALGQLIIEMAIAIEGETKLSLPSLPFISLELGASIPGYTFARFYLLIGEVSFLVVHDLLLTLTIEQPLLKGFDLETEQITDEPFRFEVEAIFHFNSELELAIDLYNFTIPPFAIGDTGLVLALEDARLDLGGKALSESLTNLLDEPEFNGIYAESALLYWLPQLQLPYAPFKGFRLRFQDIAINEDGVSFEYDLNWVVAFEQGRFLPITELYAYLFDDLFGVAVERAYGRVTTNIPDQIGLEGYLHLPHWQQIVAIHFYLEGDWEEDEWLTGLNLSQAGDQPLRLELGSPDYTLLLDNLALAGELSDDHFALAGSLRFQLQFPNFNYSLGACATAYYHSATETRFDFNLIDLPLGSVVLEAATLQVITGLDETGHMALQTFFVETVFTWATLREDFLVLEL